jgi:hypothetical protein
LYFSFFSLVSLNLWVLFVLFCFRVPPLFSLDLSVSFFSLLWVLFFVWRSCVFVPPLCCLSCPSVSFFCFFSANIYIYNSRVIEHMKKKSQPNSFFIKN